MIAGGWILKIRHDHEVAILAIKNQNAANYRQYALADKRLVILVSDLGGIVRKDADDQTAAEKAGTERHDEGVTGGNDFVKELAYAKTEQTSVSAMEANLARFTETLAKASDIIDASLGANSASRLRRLTDEYALTRTRELNGWSRGTDDIVDELESAKRGRAVEDSSVETYYHEAENERTRADQDEISVATEFGDLRKRLESTEDRFSGSSS